MYLGEGRSLGAQRCLNVLVHLVKADTCEAGHEYTATMQRRFIKDTDLWTSSARERQPPAPHMLALALRLPIFLCCDMTPHGLAKAMTNVHYERVYTTCVGSSST